MTYDCAGDWSATSGLVAHGVAPSKIVMGLPFYGAEFGATAIASTPVGPFTSLDHRDVVVHAASASEGWTAQWDETGRCRT